MRDCILCNKKTDNAKFCSVSCASRYNGKHSKKRTKVQGSCFTCNKPISKKLKYCKSCCPLKFYSPNSKVRDLPGNLYNKHARVREISRRWYKQSNKPKYCINCGYDKHYEVCHIKPVKDFSQDTPIGTINNLDNLIALCPNCHWEFDNNLIKIK